MLRRCGVLVIAIATARCTDGAAAREDDAATGSGSASASGDDGTTTSATGDAATTAADGESSSSGAISTTAGAESTTGGGVPGAWCAPVPSCEAALPQLPTLNWEHTDSSFIVGQGGPMHRGRDMFFHADETQWVLGKFAYGYDDLDLEGEQVDLFLLRDCTGELEMLGTTHTTFEGNHPTIEGVEDTGGRVYFAIPPEAQLGLGRHRIHFVVRGDDTRADAFIEVVPEGTPVVVSDVDGTLTTSETEEFWALFAGDLPDVQPGAPEALAALVDEGYHAIYLTARPEWLDARTRAFIHDRGLPPGIMHTSLFYDGAIGSAATDFKSGELAAFAARGLVPTYAFGNQASDGDAYEQAAIAPLDHRIFLQFDDPHGGRRIESWQELVPEFAALPDLCE